MSPDLLISWPLVVKDCRNRMDIVSLRQQFDTDLAAARSEPDLRSVHDKYLSRKNGLISAFMKAAASAPADTRPALGRAANDFKQHVEALCKARLDEAAQARPGGGAGDGPAPGRPPPRGPPPPRPPPPPAHAAARAHRGDLPALRLPDRRRARARGRLPQLRSAQHAGGPPPPRHAGHAVPL